MLKYYQEMAQLVVVPLMQKSGEKYVKISKSYLMLLENIYVVMVYTQNLVKKRIIYIIYI